MDEFEVEEALEDLREEITAAIGVMAACVVNAINAQPSIDNLKFTKDLIVHLDKSSASDSMSGATAGKFRDVLQSTLDQALRKAGVSS